MLIKRKKILELEDEIDRLTNEVAITTIMIETRNERIDKLTKENKYLKEFKSIYLDGCKQMNKSIQDMKRERDHYKSLYESLEARFDYLEKSGLT